MKTVEYLDAVKRRHSIPSDYKLAKVIGIQQQAISKQRARMTTMSDDTAMRVAFLLGLPPAKVLADMNAERTKSDEVRAVWEEVSDIFGPRLVLTETAATA